jgi:hypothetical protein
MYGGLPQVSWQWNQSYIVDTPSTTAGFISTNQAQQPVENAHVAKGQLVMTQSKGNLSCVRGSKWFHNDIAHPCSQQVHSFETTKPHHLSSKYSKLGLYQDWVVYFIVWVKFGPLSSVLSCWFVPLQSLHLDWWITCCLLTLGWRQTLLTIGSYWCLLDFTVRQFNAAFASSGSSLGSVFVGLAAQTWTECS